MATDITSLQSYFEVISKLGDDNKLFETPLFMEFLFRGHSSCDYELLPSLARGRRFPIDVTIFNGERNLIELTKNTFPDVFQDDMKPIELLALLQHYGIPTRLLDVTENALIALYFACCSNPQKDGEVFVFVNKDNHVENAPVISAIADSYRLTRGASYSLKDFYRAALNQPYFIEHKHIFQPDPESFNGAEWIKMCCEKVLFVHAPLHALRQKIQQARFILFPNRILDNYISQGNKAFETIIDPISKDNECIKQRMIIKHDSKKHILRDLKLCGVCESTLFGDSIDMVCKGLLDRVRQMI